MAGTRLEDTPQLRNYVPQLHALGYRTVEVFLGAASAAGDNLSRYLGTDARQLATTLPQHFVQQRLHRRPTSFPLGVQRNRIPRATLAYRITVTRAARAVTPTSVNLISELPPIRDQGNRSTCVAFALVAAIEHYLRRERADHIHLSEQFLYWDCKQHDGSRGQGTSLGVAAPLVPTDGICSERTWPYNPKVIRGNEGQGPPPRNAKRRSLQHRVAPINTLAPTSVQDVRQELLRGRCIAFSIPVFKSWLNNNEVTRTGDIVLPIPGEKATRLGHSMAIVGFHDILGQPALGGGRFIVRNSWDANWATHSSIGTTGYGTIPFSYIAGYCDEAYSVA